MSEAPVELLDHRGHVIARGTVDTSRVGLVRPVYTEVSAEYEGRVWLSNDGVPTFDLRFFPAAPVVSATWPSTVRAVKMYE